LTVGVVSVPPLRLTVPFALAPLPIRTAVLDVTCAVLLIVNVPVPCLIVRVAPTILPVPLKV